jgi:UDPglucose 6-dehydrogenase
MKISIVGLGKLGAPMAALFAAKGHEVTGLDHNPAVVSALQAGRASIAEPRLQEMLDTGRPRLAFTSDPAELVTRSDVTFIIVPTPSNADGAFSNEYVVAAIRALGLALRTKHAYHVVAVTSTVMPGSMDHIILPALEKASGRAAGADVGLCYNPEFIALGSVIDNMLKPDFLLIGESDATAGSLVASLYKTVCDNDPPARRMNFVNAELAKIAVNTFVTTKISYANMLADLCDRLPGADVEVVSEAVGSDSRIGRKYLRGAIGYGGPCFPRDNVAFAALAHQIGARADIAEATDAINRYQIDRLQRVVESCTKRGSCVAVLGMSYKQDTAVIEESQGVMLARRLHAIGYSVVAHDPLAWKAASTALEPAVRVSASLREALKDADAAVITTPWPEYARVEAEVRRRIPVIDCWRLLSQNSDGMIDVVRIGEGERRRTSLSR